ncbi:MAG: RidA family protein [Hydrogenophaga sp.]|uniref:RidA family protein n=1 Tax=Hydrogenophaga sp. TaxID=1904254 RepID=UPI00169A0639|nr:RidA family protein [Hydrogenophaga sp.]NIM41257.1 RidA family protein [Hydrogenophaga sp.]NIN26573.1 RidA family protein [Hydrogenophaga sp.]NIN31448.1 RidA family protein [Hydrogenophaga sp.]NIN55503.1 RidA family protein [Hydrogenophaga sp.]NIO51838.1 RidA family protein [Hydrogenophaga sp.]
MSMGTPMARYASARRAGDFVFMSGVVAMDPATRQAVARYDELPDAAQADLRRLGYVTGQLSVDVFEAPIVAQSWFVLARIQALAAEHGGSMADVFKLVQYFRRLPDYAHFNRVRGLFYPGEPPASTVVEVNRFLPGDELLVEVEATMYLPLHASSANRSDGP